MYTGNHKHHEADPDPVQPGVPRWGRPMALVVSLVAGVLDTDPRPHIDRSALSLSAADERVGGIAMDGKRLGRPSLAPWVVSANLAAMVAGSTLLLSHPCTGTRRPT